MAVVIHGYSIDFVRRRYGNRHTFTWGFLRAWGQRYNLGDPYPGVHWSRTELVRAVEEAISTHGLPVHNPFAQSANSKETP